MRVLSKAVVQYPLPLVTPPDYGRENFLKTAAHAEALALIDAWPAWPDRLLLLVGEAGSGKTHLGRIWAATAAAQCLTADSVTEEVVQALCVAPSPCLLLDNFPGQMPDKRLFHLLNIVREQRGFAMLLTDSEPANWPQQLPDVQSRLKALPRVTIGTPDDRLLSALMLKAFADAQVHVEDDVVAYLLPRVERSFASVQALLARITLQAYVAQRAITIPFVKGFIGA